MQLNHARVRRYLKAFDFTPLFIEELGWDHPQGTLPVQVEGETYILDAVAHKRGLAAYVCQLASIPPYPLRRKIERQVARSVHEHLVIYTDAAQATQIWQWVKREPGKPAACREHRYDVGQPGDALIQKLQAVAFSLEEEEDLTIVDVTSRVRAAFDVERVTRRFYDRFKTEQTAFLKFLDGIPNAEMQRWYVSVMINRLMFIYFIQQKGFLDDGDRDYLRHKLEESQQREPDRFYRDFLCPLFFEGFARRERDRSPEARQMLGQVPYLNGGLFLRHQIEQQHGDRIQVPDAAFEGLFAFFERYQWHLDDRPLRADNEINPGVLGYIFEKYINQKQMGAYYTEEDITDYISKNTIIPFLFDQVRRACPAAFMGEDVVWALLQDDPDRYIYPAARYGAQLDLPPEIAAGLDDVSRRGAWNTPAVEGYALPTEIWRETVARRQHYERVRARLAGGEVCEINDLITLNLDIRQFAQDVIGNCTDPAFLRAFWRAVNEVTVLDPTVGSGAFLFAALNVLEPLYEACLDRMAIFVQDLPPGSRKLPDFGDVLDRVAQHPNQRYFVLKSIIVDNLYGVDIMDEAVEIAKLRLFLKLVAEVGRVDEVEPLPDIDFNVRAGNTLVGFATYAEVERAVYQEGAQIKLMLDDNPMVAIEEAAQDVDRLYQHFRQQQTALGGEVTPEDKQALRQRLDGLADKLDRYLAQEYGVDADLPMDYHLWRESHQPFHWFVEFYGILKQGGFDVIIGNPPYVRYRDVEPTYTLRGFDSLSCGDLYAYVVERSYRIANAKGWLGVIVPISIFGTNGFKPLQDVSVRELCSLWVSCYANRPSQLFAGAQKRLAILLGCKGQIKSPIVRTGRYLRWRREERGKLFASRVRYASSSSYFEVFPASLEKLGSALEVSAFRRLLSKREQLGMAVVKSAKHRIYYTRKFGYFLAFLNFVPKIVEIETSNIRQPSELKELGFRSAKSVWVAIATLSSSTFFWFWNVLSDCRNLNRRDLLAFPLDPERLPIETGEKLEDLGKHYLHELRQTSRMMLKGGLHIETFDYASCKPIIDEIDRILAQHYGFTDEELDYIINYDIKYRMGDALFESDA